MHDSIGLRIAEARKEKDLTQTTLAKTIDLTRAALCRIENNHAYPHISTLLRISRTLGKSTDWFLTGEELEEKIFKFKLYDKVKGKLTPFRGVIVGRMEKLHSSISYLAVVTDRLTQEGGPITFQIAEGDLELDNGD